VSSLVSKQSIDKKIEKHKAFWNKTPVQSPLVGIFLGSWTFFKDNRGGDNIWQSKKISPDDIHPERFIEDYEELFQTEEDIGDDLIRAAQPFASIPWMEAMAGCEICCSRPNVWSEPVAKSVAEVPEIKFDPNNSWVCKYIEFLKIFRECFGDKHPLAASILRGPSDVLAALVGDEASVYAYVDHPEQTKKVLADITNLFCGFIKYQWEHTPAFCGGYILPQNEIWVSKKPLRFQEDASALISPSIYEEFLLPGDKKIVSLSKYNMIHLHTTSLHLLDYFLNNENVGIIQISKDDGFEDMNKLIQSLQKIQTRVKCLILRGVFSAEELLLIRRNVSPAGFCIHSVVKTRLQADEHIGILKTKWQ